MTSGGQIIVAQLGARMHYAVPRILHGAGMLERFYTDICALKGWPRLLRVVPSALRPAGLARLLDRVPCGVPPQRITAFTRFGREYACRRRRASSPTEATAAHLWAGERFGELVLRRGLNGADVLYGFNSACRKLFEGAGECDLATVMEQTIAPRRAQQRIMEAEFSDAPEWEGYERDANAQELARREQAEWALADMIVCGSEFVRQQIGEEGGPVEKCVVAPYGVDWPDFAAGAGPGRAPGPLQALFVGDVSLRKGIRHLLEAMRRLERADVRCRIVGGWSVNADVLRRHTPRNVELVGHVPRSEISREYARADVFCLPSLCEGSATVVYEALAAGLPVVTTPNAGAIVRDGVEGFIVPIRDAEALADKIASLEADHELLRRMSGAALERSRYGSLRAYGERLLALLRSLRPSGVRGDA